MIPTPPTAHKPIPCEARAVAHDQAHAAISRSTKAVRDRSHTIANQSVLLFSGFATAQAASFARNAIIGHWLSKGDFGIAATITILLQLLETLSDLGADRFIVQADTGNKPSFVANSHLALVIRGLVVATIVYFSAGPITQFFNIAHAQWAFEVVALVPLLKGFMHLDPRRFQRRLENRPYLATEVIPQITALGATVPFLTMMPGFDAVVWLALLQAGLAVIISHGLAERRYRVVFKAHDMRQLIIFGWPIWASAFPLIAVYQGDRLIIGRMFGMEELAGYTAAFMITMVPALIAAKVGNALMLPLLSEYKKNATAFRHYYLTMTEAVAALAACYLGLFLIAGGEIVRVAFGEGYSGLQTVVSWLAAMWALRMLQAAPGMALMALGDTKPLFWAGSIRALGVIMALWAAMNGHGLAGIAAAGFFAELASLFYVAIRVRNSRRNPTQGFFTKIGFFIAAAISTLAVYALITAPFPATAQITIGVLLATFYALLSLAFLPTGQMVLRQFGLAHPLIPQNTSTFAHA